MFDWLEFDANRKKSLNEQIDQMQVFLGEYIKMGENVRDLPINPVNSEEKNAKLMSMEIPRQGRPSVEVAREMLEDVLENSIPVFHPRFFSFVASAVSPYSIAGAMLTDLYNVYGGCYELSPGPAIVEEKLVSWLGGYAGYPEETRGGEFMSGGSMSTMSAMVAARDNRLDPADFGKGIAYISDQTHSSAEKGLRIIGFRQDQIVKIPTDEEFKMRTDLLEEAVKRDLAEGKKPFAVIGTVGTTNTGSIDPLEEIGDIAGKYGLWFHVDGAFGGSILLSPIYRHLAKGIEKSDSMTWDMHKWLMQTYSCSVLLVRDEQTLLNAFVEHPEYLEDISSSEHYDGWDVSPEMSKPRRGLKLWYTLQATGIELFEELIDYTCNNAKLVQRELQKRKNWEIISKPSCGTINFRYRPEGFSEKETDDLTASISKEIIESGFAYIVTTVIGGMRTLRMCMINANSTEKDITDTIDRLDEIAVRLSLR